MIRLLSPRHFATVLLLVMLLQPQESGAYNPGYLNVGIGTSYTFWTIVGRIGTFLAASIVIIAPAMFIIGAVLVMASGVKEDLRQRGKDYIIGSTLSIIVVLGAYALFRTVNCFLTPTC